jgi:hypothetical protein
MIKEEVEDVTIKQEPIEVDENLRKTTNDDDFQEPSTSTSQDVHEPPTQSPEIQTNDESKLDQIFKQNQEILIMMTALDKKFDKTQKGKFVPYLLNQDAIRPQRK